MTGRIAKVITHKMCILNKLDRKVFKMREGYERLYVFTSTLPTAFDHTGEVIYQDRNVVKKINLGGETYVAKYFSGMYFFNRVAYSIFRKSKAERSYLYSAMLNAQGIKTPPHVAWMDCYMFGFLTRSYFVSGFYPYHTLHEIITHKLYDTSTKLLLFRSLAAFILRFHKANFYHPDFSLGNIFVIPENGGFDFALVDLNRIKIQPVSFAESLKNLVTLHLAKEDKELLITELAQQSGHTPDACIEKYWQMEARSKALRRFRKRIRRYTVKPFEKLFRRNSKLSRTPSELLP